MNLVGKLSISGGKGGGAADWEDLKDKPFETLGDDFKVENGELQLAAEPVTEVDWDDIQNKPAFATVATSGDYDDLSNKPTIPVVPTDVSAFNNDAGYITNSALDGYATEQYVDDAIDDIDLSNYATQTDLQQVEDEIPQADGTTIIDNNGVWSASSAGVDIDNKSIIKNADDELQTAVPLYTEEVFHPATVTYGPGLFFDTFTYPSGIDIDCGLDTNSNTITLLQYYDVAMQLTDGTIWTGRWNTSSSDPSYYGGGGTITFTDGSESISSELYWQYEELVSSNYGYRIHIYMNGQVIDNGNVSKLIFVPVDPADTLESQLTALGLSNYWDSFDNSYTERIVHKLPSEYYDKVENAREGYVSSVYNNHAAGIQGYNIKVEPTYTAQDDYFIDLRLDIDNGLVNNNENIETFVGGGFRNLNYNGGPNVVKDGNDYYIPGAELYLNDGDIMPCRVGVNYSDGSYRPCYGTISLSGNTITVDGLEKAIKSITYNSSDDIWEIEVPTNVTNIYDFQYFSTTTTKQNIDAYFLPIDNQTIKRNADGDIYADVSSGTTPNWNATSRQDGYIQNKPAIKAGTGNNSVVLNRTGNNVASNSDSLAEGLNTTASGQISHAEGSNTTASGDYSHAEGVGTTASGNTSHAEGANTEAASNTQHVQGKWNVVDSNALYADIIGNGILGTSRSNAEATDWSGNKFLAGDVYVGVTNWTTPTLGATKLEPVSITNTLATGTAIADIDIGGVTTTLYAPAGGAADVPVEWGNSSKNSAILMNSNFMVTSVGQNSVILVSGQAYGRNAICLNSGTVSGDNGLAWGRNTMVAQDAQSGMALGDGVAVHGSYSKGIGRNINMTANTRDRVYIGTELSDGLITNAPKFMRGQYNRYPTRNDPSYLDLLANGTADNARSNAEATDMSGNKYLAGDIYVNVTDWANPQANSIKLANIPAAPTTAGTYSLQVVVDASGNPTYSWI